MNEAPFRTYMWTFPELPGPSVFLASPGDLHYLREVAASELSLLEQQMVGGLSIELYSWENDKAGDGFDDDLPAQLQIPLPDSPHCKGVVCLLGEKIGTPLPDDFPLDALAGLRLLGDSRGNSAEPRLVHPWRPGAAQEGGFALTGTTFEYLAALAANRRRRANPADGVPPMPLFLRFVGDETIMDRQVPLGKANWGGRRLRKRARQRFEEDDDALAEWLAQSRDQLLQLRNFVRFLENEGIVVQTVADAEDLRQQLRRFLARRLGLHIAKSDRDPFKGLEAYDIADDVVFFGRSAESKDAIAKFIALWRDPDKPTAFAITGGSGAGKSSFLRAGLLAPLSQQRAEGKFVHCVLRPGDLLPVEALLDAPAAATEDGPNGSPIALRRLVLTAFEHIARQHVSADKWPALVDELAADFDTTHSQHCPAWAVRRLCKALDDFEAGANMLFGFDQFEELIDQRADKRAGPSWQPVAEFLAAAARSEQLGLLYTLQANRVQLIAEDPVLGPLWANGDQKPLVFPEQNLDEIIRRPFELTPFIEIAPDLVGSLSQHISEFKNKANSGEVHGSLLPLISLTLRLIYERRALPLLEELRAGSGVREGDQGQKVIQEFTNAASTAIAEATTNATNDKASAEHEPAVVTLTVENCSGYLHVEKAIAELANEAMAEAEANTGPDWSNSTVGDLLRRLVELRGERGDQYGLSAAAIPAGPAARRLAESLRERRLLLSEREGRVRLVHEAVLLYWEAASEWLENERPLLNDAVALQVNSREWDTKQQRSRDFLAGFGTIDVDRAARILSAWYGMLDDPAVLAHNPSKALLRDYALDLLYAHPTPSCKVEHGSWHTTHMILAAAYRRADMVRHYIDLDPGSVHLSRTDGRTPIFLPCIQGDEKILQMYLEQGADPQQTDANGWRPVNLAASLGHIGCLRQLLGAGATLEAPGTPGETTLLHLAAQNGHAEMIRYLIDTCNMAPSVTSTSNWTPMHAAAASGQPASVRALCQLGVEPDAKLEYGWTPLHLAAQQGHGAVITALVEAGADVNARLHNHWTPLHIAVHSGHLASVRALLADGADAAAKAVNDWSSEEAIAKKIEERQRWTRDRTLDWQPLHLAASGNHANIVTALARGGSQPDAATADGATALHLAADKGHVAVIAPQIAAGAKPESRNTSGRTPLYVAVYNDQYDFATVLVQNGADVDAIQTQWIEYYRKLGRGVHNDDTGTMLHAAAVEARTERCAFLLSIGANPDARDAEDRTPLHFAAARGAGAVVELLLEHGANADMTARDGTTALHCACLAGHRDVVERLVGLGTVIDQPAKRGVTPLHLAALSGAESAVEFLLECGHRMDCTDSDGWTPLHVAAQQGSAAVARVLLVAGADPNAFAARPATTPLQVAAEVGHADVVGVLLAMDCDPVDRDRRLASGTAGLALALALKYGHDDAALRLVEHGERLDQIDPISGEPLAELYVRAHERRARVGSTQPESAGRLLAAFDEQLAEPAGTLAAAQPPGEVDKPTNDQLGNVSSYPWSDVPPEVIASLAKRLDPVDGTHQVNVATTAFARCTLPWYEGYYLYRLHDPSWINPRLHLYYLASRDDRLYRLDGTLMSIHEVNAKAPIALYESTALDYLRFFCFFVRGDEGPFYLPESVDDPMLPDHPVVQTVLGGTLWPATCTGFDPKGNYQFVAVIYYSNACFISTFVVQPSGQIEMLHDQPIAGDLPEKLDAPIA